MPSKNVELEKLVNEDVRRLLTLGERASMITANFPQAVRQKYLPPKFLNPTSGMLIDALTRYGEGKSKERSYSSGPGNANNIFYVRPVETLRILQQVADIVVETKKPTVFPEKAVNRKILDEQVLYTMDLVEKLKLSNNDKQIFTWWILAANGWYYSDELIESQFKILKTMYNMMYDIKMDDAFPFEYDLGIPPQDLYGHGTMSVEYTIDGDNPHTPDEGYGIMWYQYEFMLVSACANMIDEPEQHVFSTTCNCWVCMMSPEYYRILDTPPPIINPTKHSKIDGHLTYISTGYLAEVIPRFRLVGNEMIKGATPLFLSAKGVVQLTDEYMNDLILWTLKNVPDRGGVMFKSKKPLQPVTLVELFENTLKSVDVQYWDKTSKKFRGKDVLIIDCKRTADKLEEYEEDDDE